MFAHLLAITTTLSLLAFPQISKAQGTFRSINFHYSGDKLVLIADLEKTGTLQVDYYPLNRAGVRDGRRTKKRFPTTAGENEILLEADRAPAHRIHLQLGKTRRQLITNRGAWFSTPREKHVAGTRIGSKFTGWGTTDEVMISPGYRISMGRLSENVARVAVERTLARDDGFGLRLGKRDRALVLTAKGTLGMVKLTLAERLNNKTVRYWDYHFEISTELKRYEIPFDKFYPRGSKAGSIRSIYAVSLRPIEPLATGSRVVIDYLALSPGGAHIKKITGKTVHFAGSLVPSSHLYLKDKEGNVKTVRLTGERSRVVPLNTEEIWLCRDNRQPSGTVCDPPDAPLSSYGVTAEPNAPIVVDRFNTKANVNAFRQPIEVFGSSVDVEKQLSWERTEKELRITFNPESDADYAGYLSHIPNGVARGYETLAVTLRGSIPPHNILVGIKDSSGKEARIPIISYWRGDETAANPLFDLEGINKKKDTPFAKEGFNTVYIPLDAFRTMFFNVFKGHAKLKDIRGVSVTMLFGGLEVFHEIELRRIEFTKQISPVSITAFDGDQYGINALGGVTFSENKHGGLVDVRLNADGYYGKGLKVQIVLDREESYGLVAMGFGRLDVRKYNALSFFVRGEHGREDAVIYLNDGKKRAAVHLQDYTRVTTMWRKVTIPLSVFEKNGVNLERLSQVILAWEEKRIFDHTLYFDNFIIE